MFFWSLPENTLHIPEAGIHKVILSGIAHLPGKKSSTSENLINEQY